MKPAPTLTPVLVVTGLDLIKRFAVRFAIAFAIAFLAFEIHLLLFAAVLFVVVSFGFLFFLYLSITPVGVWIDDDTLVIKNYFSRHRIRRHDIVGLETMRAIRTDALVVTLNDGRAIGIDTSWSASVDTRAQTDARESLQRWLKG